MEYFCLQIVTGIYSDQIRWDFSQISNVKHLISNPSYLKLCCVSQGRQETFRLQKRNGWRKLKQGVNASSAKGWKEQNRGHLGYLIMPVSAFHLLDEYCITAVIHIIERAIYICVVCLLSTLWQMLY